MLQLTQLNIETLFQAVVLPHSLEEALQLLNDDKEAVQMIGSWLSLLFSLTIT